MLVQLALDRAPALTGWDTCLCLAPRQDYKKKSLIFSMLKIGHPLSLMGSAASVKRVCPISPFFAYLK